MPPCPGVSVPDVSTPAGRHAAGLRQSDSRPPASRRHMLLRAAARRGFVTLGAPALIALALLSAALAQPRDLPPGSLRVQQVEIIDRNGFDRPMLAATMLLPAGWQHQAGIVWTVGQRCGAPLHTRIASRAPDGVSAIELSATEGWSANNLGQPPGDGCPAGTHTSAEQYLRAWVQKNRPGAQWLDYRLRPEKSRPGAPQSFPTGGSFRDWTETGQALIGYTVNGPQGSRPVRETLAVAVRFQASQFPMVNRAPMQLLNGQAMGVLSWRAPEGQLDFRHFDAVWQTLQPAEEWAARVRAGLQQMADDNARTQREISRIQGEMARETMEHMRRRHQIRQQTREEVVGIYSGVARSRSESSDRMHRESVRTLREVEHYSVPGGGTVELPNHYRHAWRMRDGTYVLTDSPNFDPQRDAGQPGEALRRAPR